MQNQCGKYTFIISITITQCLLNDLFENSSIIMYNLGVPTMAQWKRIRIGMMRLRVRSLASLNGLRVQCCHELWCRSQTQLGSHVAVAPAWADSQSSNSTPSLGTSICLGCSPRKDKNKTKKKKKKYNLRGLPFHTPTITSELSTDRFRISRRLDCGSPRGTLPLL